MFNSNAYKPKHSIYLLNLFKKNILVLKHWILKLFANEIKEWSLILYNDITVYYLNIAFYIYLCEDDISYYKVATQSSTYIGQQFEAKSAVDRNILSCTRTDAIGGTSPNKTVWWKVDLSSVYNIYSINILFKSYGGVGMSYYDIHMKLSCTK